MDHTVSITLSEETLELLKRAGKEKDLSRVMERALRYYLRTHGQANLRALVKEGAERNAARDLQIARDWFAIDEEAWKRDEE